MTGRELDFAVRRELRTLSKDNALGVARHLVMVGQLMDSDLSTAKAHAEAAVRRAARVASVRETRGLVAYHEGDWATALSEFRTARRLSGSHHLLPLMVDVERALGRPERAIELAGSPEVRTLSLADQVELRIVVSGIRRDLGQPSAAVLALQIPQLVPGSTQSWAARLYYAYAEALLASGEQEAAREWFGHALTADPDLVTDAAERLDELDGVVLVDLLGDEDTSEDSPGADSDSTDSPGADSDSTPQAPSAGQDGDETPDGDHTTESDATTDPGPLTDEPSTDEPSTDEPSTAEPIEEGQPTGEASDGEPPTDGMSDGEPTHAPQSPAGQPVTGGEEEQP